jgi:hypothetical protein
VPLLGDSEVGWPAAGSPLIREPVAREHQGQPLFEGNPRGAVFHGHPAATRRVTRWSDGPQACLARCGLLGRRVPTGGP